MKLLMKPVEMVARFSLDGTPQPVKYKITFREEPVAVRVDQILFKTKEDLVSNRNMPVASLEDVRIRLGTK